MPSALQTAFWFRGAQWMMSQCAARFGETFSLRIAHEGVWVMVSNPEHVKQVFTGDPKIFHAGEGNRILMPVLGANSVLLLDEAPHLQQRKLLLAPFHGARMHAYRELMRQAAASEMETWPRSEPYRLRPQMQAITLEIILRAVFGLTDDGPIERLRQELRRLLDLLTDPRMLLFPLVLGPERLTRFGPFQRLMERVDALVYEAIGLRRQAGELAGGADILSLLLQARHEDGSPMSDVELRDELLTLMVAGHETTATALAWAVERLARHPEKLRRLSAEVGSGQTEYLDAVITETLRLRPVISLVARKLTQPVRIGEWELPAGVTVTPSIHLVHRRPDLYPEPDRFLPERFLDNPPGTYSWIPFGGGVRRCLGAAFAQVEMSVVLAELVGRRHIDPTRWADEPNLRRAITETPAYDAEVILT